MTSDDHKRRVAIVQRRGRRNAATERRSPSGRHLGSVCDSHQSSSVMRCGGTPQASRCAPTPSEVTKGTSRLRQLADRRVVEVVVVVVRNEHQVDRRQRTQRNRHGLEALRAQRAARATRAGPRPGRSVRAGRRSRSSTVEWPSQVARSPVPGAFAQADVGSTDGSGPCGTPPVAATKKFRDSRSRGVGVAQRRQYRVDVAKRLARPKRRGFHALEAQAVGSLTERLHEFPPVAHAYPARLQPTGVHSLAGPGMLFNHYERRTGCVV